MSPTETARRHKWIYIGAIVVLVGMVVGALLTWSSVHRTNEASRKADQLNEQLTANGFRSYPREDLARTFGTDGGPVCTDTTSALNKAQWLAQQANGAAGPGSRPVISDRRILDAGALVVKVYCPDRLKDYQDQIDDLKTGDTVR